MSRIVVVGRMKGGISSPIDLKVDPKFAEQPENFCYEIPSSRKRKRGRNRLKVRIFHHGQ